LIFFILGLVIYREVGLFFDEKTVSASRKQYITTVVAHEIAHQWFGNLVSPSWWGELYVFSFDSFSKKKNSFFFLK
jgi:aminopeptidase N